MTEYAVFGRRMTRGWTIEILSEDGHSMVDQIPLTGLNIYFDGMDQEPRFGTLVTTFYSEGSLHDNHRLWSYIQDEMPENGSPPRNTQKIRIRPNFETENWNDFTGCKLMSINFVDLDFSASDISQIEMQWKFRANAAHLTDPITRFRERPRFPRIWSEPQVQKLDWRTSGF